MDKENIMLLFNKAINFLQEHLKAVTAIVAVVVVSIFGLVYISNRPESIISNVKVTFKGYDGHGELTYNSETIQKEACRLVFKKVGFTDEQVTSLLNDYSGTSSRMETDYELNNKLYEAEQMLDQVNYKFDKTSDLRNGDKVILTVTVDSDDLPIKAEEKTFKVTGLKETKKVSEKDLLKKYPITFSGINGSGVASYDSNVFELVDSDDDDDEDSETNLAKYSNGDKVKFSITSSYESELLSSGEEVESTVIEVEVTGLKELSEVTNLSDAFSKNETSVKADYKDSDYTTYTIEKQKDYTTSKEYTYDDDDKQPRVYIVTTFKISTKSKFSDEPTVTYKCVGYRYKLKSDGSLDIDSGKSISWNSSYSKLEDIEEELEDQGYKEYVAS